MPYCSTDDVRGWLPNGQTLDDQTDRKPAGTTVTGWTTDLSGVIDSHFQNINATIPITDPTALLAIKYRMARELAYQVMAVRSAEEDKQTPPLYVGWHEEWIQFLKDIDDLKFGTTSTASGQGSTWSFTMDSVAGVVSADPSIDPKIDIGARY